MNSFHSYTYMPRQSGFGKRLFTNFAYNTIKIARELKFC